MHGIYISIKEVSSVTTDLAVNQYVDVTTGNVYKYDGIDNITFLNKKGSKLGKVSIYYDNELIKEETVNLNKKIEYEKKAYNLPIAFIIVIICIIVFIFIRVILKKKRKKKKIKKKANNSIKVEKIVRKEIKREIKKEVSKEVEDFIKEENSEKKKLDILKNTVNVNSFFNTIKEIKNIDKESLEHDFIDRCFKNIDFGNIEQLKDLYTKLKLYKKDMSDKTVKYYNKLFKYCIEEYVDKK